MARFMQAADLCSRTLECVQSHVSALGGCHPHSYFASNSYFNIIMNPYGPNPNNIPATDRYADVPFYGRYFPRPDDFRVDLQHVNSQSAASLQYWVSVVDLCNESVRIYPADEGGRDVFALGSVIVKSSHLHNQGDGHNPKSTTRTLMPMNSRLLPWPRTS